MRDWSAEALAALEAGLLEQVAESNSSTALEAARVAILGRKGNLTAKLKGLSGLAPEQRKDAGRALNRLKQSVEAAIEARKGALADRELEKRLEAECIDVTLPPRKMNVGHLHPLPQAIEELVAIFGEMGFAWAEGPHVEDDFHNFSALNILPDHPARQEQDTFYLPPDAEGLQKVLRTHTSPVQIRTMLSQQPPIRIICPGRTFRSDHDATHSPMFHQVEALAIDEAIHMGHLKGTLVAFLRAYFGIDDLPVRFRPSYFPFTEPSAEVDVGCDRSGGRLTVGAGKDWLEILGSGMVHPRVLQNCGLDPERYQGFAFGMGIERIAMLKYGIPDLRPFFESDIRRMRHYGFLPLEVPSMVRGL
ncbi:MAG: phenylalanine--tRNA ligase subunit alpha [Rhodospirillales bacterium]|nr:phenylalanine--tRNA ligase subunit alpha [Rhodospirillales bacterium]